MSTIESFKVENSLPPLITVEQLAKLLQMSTRTVWRLRSAGRVPKPVQIGGGVRWRLLDVRRWIEAGCPAGLSDSCSS